MPDPSDAVLVARAGHGDVTAFRLLVERYHPACTRYAMRILDHPEDVEDALQEMWLRVYRSIHRYQDRDRFQAWLFRILVNVCRTEAERRHRRPTAIADTESHAVDVPIAPSAVDRDDMEVLERSIRQLEPAAREALLLKYGEGLEYTEMAVMTGASVSALKMRIKRAIEFLRPRLVTEET